MRALWGSKASAVTAYILNTEADAAQCKAAIERIKGTTCECGRKKTPGVCPACDNEE